MEKRYRNVNQAFFGLVRDLQKGSINTRVEESRNGPVIQIDEPAMITYEKPLERVLFNQDRDVNPFFSVYESLWMLAGRNDVASVAYYAANMKNYSDDGKTLNGAYGYRWRNYSTPDAPQTDYIGIQVDQLDVIVKHLKEKPNSRRVVLQMWNVEDDLLKIDNGKDVCCNLNVLFSLRVIPSCCTERTNAKPNDGRNIEMDFRCSIDAGHTGPHQSGCAPWGDGGSPIVRVLDMTVLNRSNDLVWGMLGANYVHFSFLQEYMAARLGVEVGRYTQFSNNLHVYTENNSGFHPEKWLANGVQDLYSETSPINLCHVPLVRDPVMFDREVKEFVELHKNDQQANGAESWNEPFLHSVAQPMMQAFHLHKQRLYNFALEHCSHIQPLDWRTVATNWINKRKANYEAKKGETVDVG